MKEFNLFTAGLPMIKVAINDAIKRSECRYIINNESKVINITSIIVTIVSIITTIVLFVYR